MEKASKLFEILINNEDEKNVREKGGSSIKNTWQIKSRSHRHVCTLTFSMCNSIVCKLCTEPNYRNPTVQPKPNGFAQGQLDPKNSYY